MFSWNAFDMYFNLTFRHEFTFESFYSKFLRFRYEVVIGTLRRDQRCEDEFSVVCGCYGNLRSYTTIFVKYFLELET